MCGIAGILNFNSSPVTVSDLAAMTDVIAHRGPNGFGHWVSKQQNVGFGHRRLSIIDLSEMGAQPMHFENLSMVFNGEIYNYKELREQLVKKGYTFKTNSDTEVLLKLYHLKGPQCLQDLDGMFSFVIWNEDVQELFCARDRFGEKPFFYTHTPASFKLGSEIKQLFAAGAEKKVNYERLYYYAATGSLTDPKNLNTTFFANIFQLPHSHYMTVSSSGKIQVKKYWDIQIQPSEKITEEQAVEKFSALLLNSIKKRLRADVPIGTSLSGGLDSTTIASYICGDLQPESILNTFTATFSNFEKDESKYIHIFKEKYANVQPFFTEPVSSGFFSEIDQLFFHQDEPIASTSIYAQYKVMELAKKNNVTVLLDGQGADEYLGGYNKYWVVLLNQLFASKSPSYQNEKEHVEKLIGYHHQPGRNLRFMLRYPGIHRFMSQTKKNVMPARELPLPVIFTSDLQQQLSKQVLKDDSLFQDLNDVLKQSVLFSGLQELLRFADRNSMAHSREVRLPFLNHELVEFAFTLPSNLKMKNGWSKYILRKSQDKRLPQEICWRKEKIGYIAPQKKWLSSEKGTELIHHVKASLSAQNIFEKEFLNSADPWSLINYYYLLKK